MRFFISAILFICPFLALEGSCDPFFFPTDCRHSALYNLVGNEKLLTLFQAASDGAEMAQDLLGLTDAQFYSITPSTKQQTVDVYNEDIALKIVSIHKSVRSLGKDAKKSADFISNTLVELNKAVNQLIADSSVNASKGLIKADNSQIQIVVNAFKKGFPKTLNHKNDQTSKALVIAETALQEFSDQIEIYVSQVNLLVYQSSLGNPELISSNYKLVISLREFVEFSALTTFLANKGAL